MTRPFAPELMQLFSLDAKVAVITGAASGIGREAARVLALAGARVVLLDVNLEGLETTATIVREAGGVADVMPADVSDRAAVEAIADRVVQQFGGVDVWINSAGIPMWADIIYGTPAGQRQGVRRVRRQGKWRGAGLDRYTDQHQHVPRCFRRDRYRQA
jgi:NAD(P)-dependent dehydrogenase (short-subunit alcohol dehydrogenase family)